MSPRFVPRRIRARHRCKPHALGQESAGKPIRPDATNREARRSDVHSPLRSEADAFRWAVVIGIRGASVVALSLITRPVVGVIWASVAARPGAGLAWRGSLAAGAPKPEVFAPETASTACWWSPTRPSAVARFWPRSKIALRGRRQRDPRRYPRPYGLACREPGLRRRRGDGPAAGRGWSSPCRRSRRPGCAPEAK